VIDEQHPHWLRRLRSRCAWLAARLRAGLQALRGRWTDWRYRHLPEALPADDRPAFLLDKLQAEQRFPVAEAQERQLGGLAPPPDGRPQAGGDSGGQPPQARQHTVIIRPPRRR
jgi:hypothetical protein